MGFLDAILKAAGISTPEGRKAGLNESVQTVLTKFPGATILATQTGSWTYKASYTEHYVLIRYAGQVMCLVVEEWNDNRMTTAPTRDYNVITSEGVVQVKGPRATQDVVRAYFGEVFGGYINHF